MENQICLPNEPPMKKRPSLIEQFAELNKDQDFQQKMTVGTTLVLEVYRVLMGALLILFVPQNCDGQICSFTGNFNRSDEGLTKSAFAFNMLTLLSFIVLYKIEVARENKMINYLNVNPNLPRDNDAVKLAIQQLDPIKKNQLWDLDTLYRRAGYVSMGAFAVNSTISTYVIGANYLNDKTLTVLLTNLLFMGLKIKDVFAVVNTEQNVFLSSYLTRKIQYNDIDSDHLPAAKLDDDLENIIVDVIDVVDEDDEDDVSVSVIISDIVEEL